MTIQGKSGGRIYVSVPEGQIGEGAITIAVQVTDAQGNVKSVTLDVDVNHSYALEMGVRACRLECEARSKSI